MNKIQLFRATGVLAGALWSCGVWAGNGGAAPAAAAAAVAATAGAADAGAKPVANAGKGAADTQFEQLVDDFVFGTLALSPTTATGVGYQIGRACCRHRAQI